MKKYLFLSFIFVLVFTFIACAEPIDTIEKTNVNKSTANSQKEGEEPVVTKKIDNIDNIDNIVEINDAISYFEKLNTPDKVTIIENNGMQADELMLAQSLQGLTARTKPCILIDIRSSLDWIYIIKKQIPDLTLEYVDTVWDALDKYTDILPKKQYVLYDVNDGSINAACTISSAEGVLVANKEVAAKLEKLSFTMFADARGMKDEDTIIAYKDKLNLSSIVQQIPDNIALRDFGIAYKLPFFFYDAADKDGRESAVRVHSLVKTGSPVFGWGPGGEDDHVAMKTSNGLITIPSDHSWNLSLYSGFRREKLSQINEFGADVVPEKDTHYVALIMTDGDNVQWILNDYPANEKWFANSDRGKIPMGWMLPPIMGDIAPQNLKWIFKNQTKNDVYINALSGMGYFFPTKMKPEILDNQLQKLERYLNDYDFSIMNIMDVYLPTQEILEKYAKIDKLKGALMFTYGGKYIDAHGDIMWANNKPFVTAKYSLWESDPVKYAKEVAADIDMYDYTSEQGYSVVAIHCWSHGYQDAVTFAETLVKNNPKVKIVRPDQLVKLVSDNIVSN